MIKISNMTLLSTEYKEAMKKIYAEVWTWI